MRRFLPCLGFAIALAAQAPLHVVGVERRGPPPYEAADRVYRVDGGLGQGLRVGDRLLVRRAGEAAPIGHLRVILVRGELSEARFEPAGTVYPMKGDLALREELKGIPSLVALDVDPLPDVPRPLAKPEAPPREGLLFFLPQKAELSLAGLKKLEAWVEAWGLGGRWAVQVPRAKALSPALQKERAESISHALRALGIQQVNVESEPRSAEGKYDPAWVRHWD